MVGSLFIVGGARSGKSRFAVERVRARGRVVFVATAEARDEEMANRIARHRAERPPQWTTVEEPFDALGELIGRRRSSFTVVSNEVGEGVHPETAAGLRFRDLLGSVNQRVAAACDTVVLMVAGVPLTIKAPPVP